MKICCCWVQSLAGRVAKKRSETQLVLLHLLLWCSLVLFLHWQKSHTSLADYKRFKTATEGIFLSTKTSVNHAWAEKSLFNLLQRHKTNDREWERERDGEKSNWKARGEAENKSDCEKQRCWVLLGDTTTGNLCNPPSNLSWLEPRICRTGTRRGATDTEQRPSSTQFWKVNK